ncbi:YdeI/OmpD-associated family protein [Asticcacaulis sp. BYS171W]|uniref:YdeI/OmpD-associated family protein n=1 Tax=Asticcacaulis aquaticus TaxID=2984212 RepID=A0ABT5HVT7_9CAUL|nr:YdeI/OmpD-associated family protein [Asticcacaulis aquaticus]MDC7684190.1 YdeI/OmpD-associated family protein [Asticcacaulis aquaticus]
MTPTHYLPFATRDDLSAWLAEHHATKTELWVRMYKKAAALPSVTWEDCVVVALMWGWIDGQRQALDEISFVQRLSPRRPGSNWSKKNCDHVERLMTEGLMQPSGLRHVEAARADGRWDSAYAGSSEMAMPADFLAALADDPKAATFYSTLNRANLFAIYHRLQTAKRPETRAKRMVDILGRLREGTKWH